MTTIIIQNANGTKGEIRLPYDLTNIEVCQFAGLFGRLAEMTPFEIEEMIELWKQDQYIAPPTPTLPEISTARRGRGWRNFSN